VHAVVVMIAESAFRVDDSLYMHASMHLCTIAYFGELFELGIGYWVGRVHRVPLKRDYDGEG
jgi:hypothetical protein